MGWTAPAALLIAVIACALAAWALVSRPSPSPAVATPDGDSKARVCTAFHTVAKAVQRQTHAELGPDPVAQRAVAGNARLAMLGGGEYLLNQLDSTTPAELADAARSFATHLQDIGMNALAEVANADPAQATRISEADALSKQINTLCT